MHASIQTQDYDSKFIVVLRVNASSAKWKHPTPWSKVAKIHLSFDLIHWFCAFVFCFGCHCTRIFQQGQPCLKKRSLNYWSLSEIYLNKEKIYSQRERNHQKNHYITYRINVKKAAPIYTKTQTFIWKVYEIPLINDEMAQLPATAGDATETGFDSLRKIHSWIFYLRIPSEGRVTVHEAA